MSKENNRDNNKEKFSLGLAVFDFLPVALFGIAAFIIGIKLGSILFAMGAVICIIGGMGKVLWKILIAVKDKDIPFLAVLLRICLPAGFALMVIGTIIADKTIRASLWSGVMSVPSLIFFILGIVGIAGMVICAAKMDKYDVKANLIEQIINSFAQGFVLIGVLFL